LTHPPILAVSGKDLNAKVIANFANQMLCYSSTSSFVRGIYMKVGQVMSIIVAHSQHIIEKCPEVADLFAAVMATCLFAPENMPVDHPIHAKTT